MKRLLSNVYNRYQTAITNREAINGKQLITRWKAPMTEKCGGQFFERKILPNGNIKTRIITIYSNNKQEIGLETKVVTPSKKLVYKTIGLIKKSTSRFKKSIKALQSQNENHQLTKQEQKKLKSMELCAKQCTKAYGKNFDTSKPKEAMYKHIKEAKTLLGDTFVHYNK